MDCIVFIGTQRSGSGYEALGIAKGMGYFTVLITDIITHLERRQDFPDVDLMEFCDLHDYELIRRRLESVRKRGLKVCAIVSFKQAHCHTAALMAKENGLPYFTPGAIEIMQDKIKTRQAIAGTAYSPYYRVLSGSGDMTAANVNERLPLILKNPVSTGSKSVIMVNSYAEYAERLVELGSERGPVLLEEYMEGPQYLVELLVVEGKAHIIAIVEQEISYKYRFIVTGYGIITNPDSEFIGTLRAAATELVSVLGLAHGACHLELRFTKDGWKLVEANPRISGGAMNRLIETAHGVNLVAETLKLALGRVPAPERKYSREAFAHYATVKREGILVRITGRNRARQGTGVRHLFVKPRKGQLLIPPMSMGNRYACAIATGDTAQEAMANAKRATGRLRFHTREIDSEVLPLLTHQQMEMLSEYYANRWYRPQAQLQQ